ncbi:tyrosine-type recombinase/integrase [Bacillus sp. DJP31]|uniref:tyrosine-type recombinase/integrase n=1 Tax=Bacillus sp. DJP31 TaxID=3409789 RepID=UPI003BB6BDC9
MAEILPAIKARKQNRIPSVWTSSDVTKLLEAIYRGNPAGKRDYAIILLVARLGIRTKDIKNLKLEHLKWQSNRIIFTQSKTDREISLPLLHDIGWAIIDYLKSGRPKVELPYVFLRHLAPLEPFSDEDRLHQIIVKYMKLAQFPLSLFTKESGNAFFKTHVSQCFARKKYPIVHHL